MDGIDSFWNFSVGTYRQPGVAEACLSLQDRYGLDVNLLLYNCWFGCTRGLLDEPLSSAVLAFSEPWAQEVVRPLRAARTWMKISGCVGTGVSTEDCMALRDEIKAVELKAERLQQRTLEGLASAPPAGPLDSGAQLTNTAANLKLYLEHCSVRLDETSLSELAHIVTAAIDGAEESSVVEALGTAPK